MKTLSILAALFCVAADAKAQVPYCGPRHAARPGVVVVAPRPVGSYYVPVTPEAYAAASYACRIGALPAPTCVTVYPVRVVPAYGYPVQYVDNRSSTAGTVVGAIVGGVVGHNVGRGHTVEGAVIGAIVGGAVGAEHDARRNGFWGR